MLDHLRTQLQALARAVVEADKLAARLDKIRQAVAKGRRPDAA
jgi:hypothetical protein